MKIKPIILIKLKLDQLKQSVKVLRHLLFLPRLRTIIRKKLYMKLFKRELKFLKDYFKKSKNT